MDKEIKGLMGRIRRWPDAQDGGGPATQDRCGPWPRWAKSPAGP
jgi:hypothetical protein